ncbi:MAG: class I SAM-dependent methyltransferase [Vicinamibacteria bacterium]
MTTADFAYVGSELELFARATNWKRYIAARVQPYLGADVLEAGAGLGATTRILCTGAHGRWVCLEPDARLGASLTDAVTAGELPACCQARVGRITDLDAGERFDSILYVDVLEHIEDDRAELAHAAGRLTSGGKVIVLAPAHQSLFTPFDEAIGHFRRYDKSSIRAVAPTSLRLVVLAYLDSVGLLASAANRLVLGSGMPTKRQIWIWDKLMIPASRCLDPLLFGALGKSVLAVWELVDQAEPSTRSRKLG